MRKIVPILLALVTPTAAAASQAAALERPPAPADDRLAVSFFTAAFLAEATARVVADRIQKERLAGGYLQEQTGLIWARRDNGEDLDWYAADDYCHELEVGDWADWRLPSIDELEILHDKRSNAQYKLPAPIKLTGCCPWSDTRSGDSSAWNFSFRYRKRFSGSLNLSYELRALCVRAAGADDLLFYEEFGEEPEKEAPSQLPGQRRSPRRSRG